MIVHEGEILIVERIIALRFEERFRNEHSSETRMSNKCGLKSPRALLLYNRYRIIISMILIIITILTLIITIIMTIIT